MKNSSVDEIPKDADIAGIGDEHLNLLANICEVLEDEAVLEKMKQTGDVQWILDKLS